MNHYRLSVTDFRLATLVRLALIVTFLCLGSIFLPKILLQPKMSCISPVSTINAKKADEIMDVILRSLPDDDIYGGTRGLFVFENPRGESVRAWRYNKDRFVEVNTSTVETAKSGISIYIFSLRWNKASVCFAPLVPGPSGFIYEWELKKQSGQWNIVSKEFVAHWDTFGLP
jgi:hypothetical protein